MADKRVPFEERLTPVETRTPFESRLEPTGEVRAPDEGRVRRFFREPFRARGRVDVAKGTKTPAQAEEAARDYGDIVLDTILMTPVIFIPELAIPAAVARYGPFLGKILPTVAARSGAAGAIKVAQKAAQGRAPGFRGDPLQTPGEIAGEGAAAAAGEILGGEIAPTVLTKVAQSVFPGAVVRAEAGRIVRGARKVLPERLEGLGGIDPYTVAGPTGRQIIKDAEEAYGEVIVNTIKRRPLKIPALGETPVGFPVAWGKLHEALRTGDQALAGAIRGQLEGELARLDPIAAQQFQAMEQALRAGRAYRELMQIATGMAGEGSKKAGAFDRNALIAYVNRNAERLQNDFGPYWDSMRSILTRAQPLPAEFDRPARPLRLLRGASPWPKLAGSPQPLGVPESVANALRMLGAAEPEWPIGGARLAYQHRPFQRRGPGEFLEYER